jgi:hypothetical protein
MSQQSWSGGCQCGAVRYEIASPPVELYVCHCRECQKQSSSAFGISAIFLRPDFRLTQGEVRSWTRDADSGGRVKCNFCPDCGSRVWHEDGEAMEPTVSVKGGSLDQPIDLTDAVHIWVSRKLPGVVIPVGVTSFPEEPE